MSITKEIIKKLDALYPDYEVYGESIEQGFAEPCFSVRQISSSTKRYPSKQFETVQTFDVRYFPSGNRPLEACREMGDALSLQLEELPGMRGVNIHHEIVDSVLHFFVSYRKKVRLVQEGDIMETYAIRANRKE